MLQAGGAQRQQLARAGALELVHQRGQHIALALGTRVVAAVQLTDSGVGKGLTAVQMGVGAVGFQILVGQAGFVHARDIGKLGLLVDQLVDHGHLIFGDVHFDAAELLGDLLEAVEVDVDIVFDVHAEALVHDLHGQLFSAEIVGGVDAVGAVVLADIRKLHGQIAHDGGQLDLAGLLVDGADDHAVGAGAVLDMAFVGAQQQDVDPLLGGQRGVDAQVGDHGQLVGGKALDIGVLVAEQTRKGFGVTGARLGVVASVRRDIADSRRGSGLGRVRRRILRTKGLDNQQYDNRDDHDQSGQQQVEAPLGLTAALRRTAARARCAGRAATAGSCARGPGACGTCAGRTRIIGTRTGGAGLTAARSAGAGTIRRILCSHCFTSLLV